MGLRSGSDLGSGYIIRETSKPRSNYVGVNYMNPKNGSLHSGKERQFLPGYPRFEPRVRHLFPLVQAPFPLVWIFFPLVRAPSHLSGLPSRVYACSLLGPKPLGWGTKKKKKKTTCFMFHHSSVSWGEFSYRLHFFRSILITSIHVLFNLPLSFKGQSTCIEKPLIGAVVGLLGHVQNITLNLSSIDIQHWNISLLIFTVKKKKNC